MNSLHKNIFSNLLEMKDWKQHFTNGTKGMPKTDPMILGYVESILKKSFDGNEDKVNNCPIAPWLVKVVSEIGPMNINTEKLNRMKAVIEYVKKTGNIANIPKLDLIQGSDFAKEKLDKMAEKEKQQSTTAVQQEPSKEVVPQELSPEEKAKLYQEKSKELFPELIDEKNGDIERVWTCLDGTGRIWIKVLNNNWLKGKCETGDSWGIWCQGSSFGNSKYVNYQLIGPSKGQSGQIKTIVGIGVLKSTASIAEAKQEENVQPGSQKSSGGWTDADEKLVEFLTMAPETKWIKYFGDYYGNVVLDASDSLHGGGIGFLYHLAEKKPELFKELAERRPDMIEANREIIEQIFPNAEDLLNFNIEEFAKENPDGFLLNLERYIEKFGKEAIDIFNTLDLNYYIKQKAQLIENILPTLVDVVTPKKLEETINNMNLSNFIWNNKLKFYKLINKLSVKNNKPIINNLLTKYFTSIVGENSEAIKSTLSFLREMEKPKLDVHVNATKDKIDSKYYSTRIEYVKDENGNDVVGEDGEKLKKEVRFQIPDNLLILTQKERKDFIKKNEQYLKQSINSDEKGKEITFLRLLFSQSNIQDIEKTMRDEKNEFIDYYDQKFKSGEKKKVKLGNNNDITEVAYMPGEFELFSIINPKGVITKGNKIYYPIGIDIAKKNATNIIKYYYDSNLLSEKEKIKNYYGKRLTPEIGKQELIKLTPKLKYEAVKDYVLTLIYSGEKEEEALDFFIKNFPPEKMGATNKLDAYNYILSNVKDMLSDDLFLQTLNKMKPILEQFGEQGNLIYQRYISELEIQEYFVKPGDIVTFKGSNYELEGYDTNWKINIDKTVIYSGPMFLTPRNRYKVLDVGIFAGSKNGKILVQDDGYTSVVGERVARKKRWFSSNLFKINSEKSININEQIFRFFVQNKIKLMAENKSISYTGIILDKRSKSKLNDWVKDMIKYKKLPNMSGWEWSADHATLNTGRAQNSSLLEQIISIKVLQYAFDDKIAAISIVPIINGIEVEFTKDKPHITIAFDKANGARPVQSNELINWKPVPKSFILTGRIKEVPL